MASVALAGATGLGFIYLNNQHLTTERSHDARITKLEQALIGVTTTVQDVNIRVGSIADQIASQDLRKEVQNILSLLGPIGTPPAATPFAEEEGCVCEAFEINTCKRKMPF